MIVSFLYLQLETSLNLICVIPSRLFFLLHFHTSSMWDGEVRCYELSESAQCVVKASVHMGTPVLCSAWMGDSASILAGCADKELRRWDVESGQVTTVGRHDAPIQEVQYVHAEKNCV